MVRQELSAGFGSWNTMTDRAGGQVRFGSVGRERVRWI